MKPRTTLRFVVGSALLAAPLGACGPDRAEEVPLRTNVGEVEEPAPNPVPEEKPEPTANPAEPAVEPAVEAPTMESTTASAGEGEHDDPSTNPASDPLINPSSGERLQQVPPDAPYHPAKQR